MLAVGGCVAFFAVELDFAVLADVTSAALFADVLLPSVRALAALLALGLGQIVLASVELSFS